MSKKNSETSPLKFHFSFIPTFSYTKNVYKFFTLLLFPFLTTGLFDSLTSNTSFFSNETNEKELKIIKNIKDATKNASQSTKSINTVFLILIGASTATSFLLFNGINNNYVHAKLAHKNPNKTIEQINDSIKFGFVLSLAINGLLIYVWYKYNSSQENLNNDLNKVTQGNYWYS